MVRMKHRMLQLQHPPLEDGTRSRVILDRAGDSFYIFHSLWFLVL